MMTDKKHDAQPSEAELAKAKAEAAKPVHDKTPKAAPKPAAAKHDPAMDVFYEQGRTARRSAIAKEDAPHGDDSNEYKAWLKGWQFEDGRLG